MRTVITLFVVFLCTQVFALNHQASEAGNGTDPYLMAKASTPNVDVRYYHCRLEAQWSQDHARMIITADDAFSGEGTLYCSYTYQNARREQIIPVMLHYRSFARHPISFFDQGNLIELTSVQYREIIVRDPRDLFGSYGIQLQIPTQKEDSTLVSELVEGAQALSSMLIQVVRESLIRPESETDSSGKDFLLQLTWDPFDFGSLDRVFSEGRMHIEPAVEEVTHL